MMQWNWFSNYNCKTASFKNINNCIHNGLWIDQRFCLAKHQWSRTTAWLCFGIQKNCQNYDVYTNLYKNKKKKIIYSIHCELLSTKNKRLEQKTNLLFHEISMLVLPIFLCPFQISIIFFNCCKKICYLILKKKK
jgi:hypothetical protein